MALLAVLAAAIGLTVARETQSPLVATPHFLTRALGRQLPQHAPGGLVPKRFIGAGYATPVITKDSFALARGDNSISLISAPATPGSWSRHAGGVSGRTSFGRTTVTVGLNSIEQFLTVGQHLGSRTWKWNLSSLGLHPRLTSDGQVHFYKHGALTGWRVARPLIENTAGKFITPQGTQWQLSKMNGHWILALKLDDSQLPIPYTIDPGIALRGACSNPTAGTPAAGCSTAISSGSATSVTVTAPSGVLNGDALIAQVVSGTTPTTATGFTKIDSVGTTVIQQDDYRVANGDTSSSTYSWSGSSPIGAAVYDFSGTNATTPVDQHVTNSGTCGASGTGTCTATASAVTTTQSNEMPIALYAAGASAAFAQTAGQGLTQGYTLNPSHGSGSYFLTGASGTSVQASAGTTGSFTGTATAAGQAWVSSTISLQPAFSTDGQGTNVVSPTSVTQSTTGNTFAFTFTPATGGIGGGAVRIQVPSTWTQPQLVSGTAGYTTASTGTLSIDSTTSPCTSTSKCILVSGLTRADTQTLVVTYGAGGGTSGVTAPSSTGPSTFSTTEKSTSAGTLTAIGASPSVTVSAAACTSCTWTGGGGNSNWSTGANWSGGGAPATNGTATLTFPSGASQLSNNNDFTAGTTFAGITISGSGYTLAGNSVALGSSGITDSTTSGSSTISLALSMAAARTVTVTNAAETLTLSGIVSGSGGSLTKAGSGVLTLSGANTFTGGTTLSAGQLNVNNATALGTGTFTVSGGTIDNTSGGSITESSNNAQAWNGDFTFNGSNALSLGTGAVTLGASRQVTVSASTLTVGGVVSGSGFSLTKAGSGALTLSGANTFTGGTTLSAGTLNINNATALGTGTFTVSGGTIDNTSGGSITESSNNAQAWNGDFTFTGTNALNLGTGAVTLGASRQVTVSANNLTVGGIISGSTFGLTKAGAGTLTLTGSNTYTGNTTISAGTLNANSTSALGSATNSLVFSGGTLQAGGTITSLSGRAVTLSSTGAIDTNGNPVSIAGVISGSAGLTKGGTGTLTLTGANTYLGNTTISAGSVLANSSSALGDATNSLVFFGGTLVASAPITFPSSRAVTLSSTGTVDTNGNAVSIGGVISGSNGLTKAGTGTLTLTGTNTYLGNTTISAGTLNASSSSNLGNASDSLVFSGGTLQAGGTITSPSTRTVTLSSTGTIDTNGNSVSVAGVISGSSGLTKTGTGTLTLSATNTYSGTTTVSAGTLAVNGSQSSSAVSLNGGKLSGTGTTGAVTSTASGGTLSPGTPPGILNTGNVDLSTGSPTFSVALNGTTAGTNYSQLNVTGTVNLTGATLSGSLGYTPTNGDTYTIINNDSTDAVTGTFSGLPQGTGLTVGGKTFRISYTGGDGNDVVLTAGGATKLAITSVPANATANVNFSVTVQSQDPNGNCVAVNSNTGVSLSSDGAGTLSGNTGTITAGTCTVTLSSVQDSQGETIHLTAARTSGDSLTSSSASSGIVVANGTFTTNTAVAVNGTPTVGTSTTITQGSYTPTPTARTYQWARCDSFGASCTDISGATSSSYTPVAGDVGSTLKVVESVTHAGYDNGSSISAASAAVVKGSFTTNTGVSVSGTPTVGTAFAAVAGSYTPSPSSSAYQWQLCDSNGANCSNITNATSSSYTPVAGDVGSKLKVIETVSKSGYNDGSSTSSASSAVVKGSFTTNTGVSVSGTPTVGTGFSATAGAYTPSPTSSAYQWQLCDSNGANCSPISGATNSSYTPVAGDVGSKLKVVETVSKGGYNDGSSTSSASSAVVKGSFTTNTGVSVSGTPTVGTSFSAIAGSYSPVPTSSAYQWQLCDSNGANCSPISGATNSSYTPVAGDVGSKLKVVETVSKSGYNDGSSTSSASSAVVKGSFTTNTGVSVSGTPTVGTSFSAIAGSYSPVPTSSAYQWQLCDSNGANCSNITNATNSSYTPVAGDVGSTLKAIETVSKSGYNDGSSTSSASAAVVKGSFTTNTGVSVSGMPTVGTSFAAVAGSYSPVPASSAYQWQLCDGSGNSCSPISGATSSSYTPVAGDVGSTLKVVETVSKGGYNDASSTSAASDQVVKGDFATNSAVSVSGTPKVGTPFTATAGSYSPAPGSASYQWALCDGSGNNCSTISGATSSSYTPVPGDVGSTLVVVESVSKAGYNDGGSASGASAKVVKGDFTTNSGVSVSGTPTVGTPFTATAGSYTPTPTSSAYQWKLCDSGGANCSTISGATSSSYTPVAGDVGSTLKVVETVSKGGYNDGGSTSDASSQVVAGAITTDTAVAINGTPTVGTATTITPGGYTPTPTSRTYQWELCDSAGNNCSNISGATSSTYTPVAGDVGLKLKVVETVSKTGYSDGSSTSSASVAVVKGDLTTNSAVSVSGTPAVGTASHATPGSYSPAPDSASYQWELCDGSGANCSDISGATSSSYTPVAGDVGSTLIVVESVSKAGYNDSGSASAASDPVVKGDFTTDTAVAINGTPAVGAATTIAQGGYTPSPSSRTYQWKLCDSGGGSCSDISGATSSSYTPVAGDVGSTLKVVETVSKSGYNNGGSTSAASAQVVKGSFTTDSAVSVSGTPTVDTAFNATAGSYTPSPTGTSYQWKLCDGSGGSCSNISGATSSSYTPVAGDVGSTLKVVETVSKSGYNDSGSTSAASAAVVKASFTTNSAVSVSGTPTVGTAFDSTPGSYSPAPTGTSYQWQLCDGSGNSCSPISGATSSSYTPVAGDVGSTLKVVETVSKGGYNDASSTSAASDQVVKGDFATNSAVSVSGTPKVGTPFTATAGSYSPAPGSASYQWALCDGSGNNCSTISGATSSSYTPVPGDVGSTLVVVESVSKAGYNDSGSASGASAKVVKGDFTTNSGVSVSGTPTVGTPFTATAGSYTPASGSASYQWKLCDGSGNSCSPISGATSSSYSPVAGDVGSTLKVVETVSKGGYNDASSTSAASDQVVKGDFATNSAVSVSGTPKVGVAFTATAGSYSPAPGSASYQWALCDGSGNNCSTISGATSSSYTPVPGDVGSTLVVVESVSKAGYNDGGSASGASAKVVKGDFATNTAVAVNGTPTVGTATTLTQGDYTPAPGSRSYQWQLCDGSGDNCSDITGATGSSYTPGPDDVGLTLRVAETASASGYNDGGSTSDASDPVGNGNFTTDSAVSVSGTPAVGTAFSATPGSYSPGPAGSTYQWELCNSSGGSCSSISGATSSSYTPVAGDLGSTLKVVETVLRNGYNNGGSTSSASDQVVKGDFSTDSAVSVSGTPTVGMAFDANPGSYTPAPDSASYQWKLCDSSGNNCSDISGATSSSYTPDAGDVGATLRVVETVSAAGYNDGGSVSAASDQVVNGDFTTDSAVSVSGTPTVGTSFDANPGSYTPAPDSASYQWELCDSSGNNCSDISGATSSSYTPDAGDVGATLRVIEMVSKAGYNDGGSASSASAAVVKGDFATNSAVAVNGTPTVGTATTLTQGDYTPAPGSRSYQWQLCDGAGSNCSDISGATSSTYTPDGGDLGSTLRVIETVSAAGYNDGGSTSDASDKVVTGPITTDTAVSVDGTPTVGTAFAAIAGSYSPAPDSVSYQWELCDGSGANCSDIGGATASSYTPVAGDVGSTLRVVETASKSGYSDGSSTSDASSAVVKGDITTDTAVSVSGTPTVGSAFTATSGSYSPDWTGTTYQWQLCDSGGNSCSDISGATAIRYYPVASDVGSTLRVVQTVSLAGYNDGGSTSSASAAVVNGDFVTNTAVAVNGAPTVGTASHLTQGSYTPGPATRSYQWELCDSGGGNCSSISGATGSSYTPVPSDVGSTLRVVESVSRAGYNDGGSTSDASAAVVSGDFSTSSTVAVNGTPTVGTTTTITKGGYTPSPTSRSYQWELCDGSGNSCSNISGATNSYYTPVASDVGSTLRVVESVSRAGYNDGASTSDASAAVVKSDFVTNSAVSVSGTPTVGSSFTAAPGSYSPAQTSTTYQWELCDGSGNSCSNISGANSIRYYPVPSDVGSTLRVVQTVSRAGFNDGGSTSSASAPVAKADFATNTAVAINGTPTVGTPTRFTQGGYTPAPTARSYQWELCDSGGGNCSNISGATGSSYIPVASDVGSTLRVVEAVSRAGYNDGSSTSAGVVVKGDFVTNSPVAINAGTPTVGTLMTITKGSYTPAPSRSYQWESCNSSGNSCSNISGATNSYYTPTAADVGGTLRVVETASKAGYNDGGSTSDPSGVVVKGTFSINSGVSVAGTPTVGSAFTATAGSYAPSQTSTSYQWQLCDGSGNNCSNIAGATSRTYFPVASDVGSTLQVVETVLKAGYNDGGSTSTVSGAVTKGDFVTQAAVAITGTPTVGTATAISKGTYTPSPTTRTYQWELCDSSGANCSNISGATSSSYRPAPGDVGSTLRVVESVSRPGIDDGGSTSAASAVVIKGDFVTNYGVSISGTPTVAQPFTATAGSYSPGQSSTSYQWELCDSGGANCSNISGATSRRYYPVASDVGSTLRIVETVSRAGYNDSGSTSVASALVAKGDFIVNSPVALSGTPVVGSGFTATAGSYAPGQTSTSYQWELCDSGGANCSNIFGATSRRYYPVASDVGSTLRIVESVSRAGYNDNGSTSAASNVVAKGDFVVNTAVTINGSPTVGTTTTLTKGVYTPGPTTRTYQWRLCDNAGLNCQDIAGATRATYTPVASDRGWTLRVVETVSKAGYNNSSSTSAASAPVH